MSATHITVSFSGGPLHTQCEVCACLRPQSVSLILHAFTHTHTHTEPRTEPLTQPLYLTMHLCLCVSMYFCTYLSISLGSSPCSKPLCTRHPHQHAAHDTPLKSHSGTWWPKSTAALWFLPQSFRKKWFCYYIWGLCHEAVCECNDVWVGKRWVVLSKASIGLFIRFVSHADITNKTVCVQDRSSSVAG